MFSHGACISAPNPFDEYPASPNALSAIGYVPESDQFQPLIILMQSRGIPAALQTRSSVSSKQEARLVRASPDGFPRERY